MNVNPRLIIHCCHFIITHNKETCCKNIYFNCNEHNAMHYFCNFPSDIITLMLLWHVLHLQKLKQQLHGFKVNERLTLFQKSKDSNKLHPKKNLFSTRIPQNHHVCNYISSLTIKQVLIFCMLTFYKHIILPHNIIGPFFSHLCLPSCFRRLLNFGIGSLSLLSIYEHT